MEKENERVYDAIIIIIIIIIIVSSIHLWGRALVQW